jgi:hypothetical protein
MAAHSKYWQTYRQYRDSCRPKNLVNVMAPAAGETSVGPVPYLTKVDQSKAQADLPSVWGQLVDR